MLRHKRKVIRLNIRKGHQTAEGTNLSVPQCCRLCEASQRSTDVNGMSVDEEFLRSREKIL